MESRTTKIPNGDQMINFIIYLCDDCGCEICESEQHIKITKNGEEKCYCYDCAFKSGIVSEKEFLEVHGIWSEYFRAGINSEDKEIYIVSGRKLPWEKVNKDHRKSVEYREWRKTVFERDKYKCAICNKVGGKLEAHHIEPISENKDRIFDVDNGVTLCKSCHREVHKTKDKEWLHGK